MYEIIIKKDVIVKYPESQSYEKLADRGGDDSDMVNGGPKYGYVTKPAYEKSELKVVYQQQVDDMDIVSVITAINGIKF
jgi:hypothetical protein